MRSRLPLSMRMRKVGNYAPPTPGGPAAFDPTDVGFSHVYWTGGTEFTALGLSDTDAVSSWPDEVGTEDLAQATGTKQPFLDDDGVGGQPGVCSDNVDDHLLKAFAANIVQPLTLVAVAQTELRETSSGIEEWIAAGYTAGPALGNVGGSGSYSAWLSASDDYNNAVYTSYGGADAVVNGQPALVFNFVRADAATCESWAVSNGVMSEHVETHGAGAQLNGFTTHGRDGGGTFSQQGSWKIAFLAVIEGDLRDDPNYYNFLDWVYDTYAIDARPPSLVGWAHSYWTSGPEFEALGLSDGNAVSSWPDEQNATNGDMSNATGTEQPTLVASDQYLNDQPSISFDGVDDMLKCTANYTQINYPYSITTVCQLPTRETSNNTYRPVIDGTGGYRHTIGTKGNIGDSAFFYFGGSTISAVGTQEVPTLEGVMLTAYWDLDDGDFELQGLLEGSDSSGTPHNSARMTTGGTQDSSNHTDVHQAFVGIFDGDVRTDPYWEQAESYLRWKYGLFDPINDVAWDAAYWTEGTEFTALGLSDTDAVGTWPDEVGTNDLVQATGTKQPTLDVDGAPNGNPQLVFDGTDDLYEATSALSLTQPWSAVMIGQVRYQGGVTRRMWTAANGGFANGLFSTVSDHAVYCGATLTGTGSDNADHLFVTVLNGTSSDLKIDTVLSEGDAGTQGVNTKHVVGAQNTSGSSIAPLDCCFFAIYDGDVTADPGWPFFLQWVEQHYNLTQFDPVGDVGWSHAYWTEGAEFLAQGYADTDAVSSWPDEVGTADLAQATGSKQPIYDADGGPNSTPSVYFDETDDFLTEATASVSQGLTIVMIGQMLTTPNDGANHMIGGATVTRPLLHYDTSGNNWFWYAGTNTNTGVAHDTDNHLHVAYFDGASSKWDIDGTQIDAANVGTDNLSGITMGAQYDGAGSYSDVDVSFAAVFDGDVTTDPNWQRFLDWAREHYGLPVAIG